MCQAFPLCSCDAQVLYESGYTYLDVRPTYEYNEVGKVCPPVTSNV